MKTGALLDPEDVWAEPENTGGLVGLLQVAVGLRVMLRYNIDKQSPNPILSMKGSSEAHRCPSRLLEPMGEIWSPTVDGQNPA